MRAGREMTCWKEVLEGIIRVQNQIYVASMLYSDIFHALWLRQILKRNWNRYKFITGTHSVMMSLLHVYSLPGKMVISLLIRILNIQYKILYIMGNYLYEYLQQGGGAHRSADKHAMPCVDRKHAAKERACLSLLSIISPLLLCQRRENALVQE